MTVASISQATRLKANVFLAEKALEMGRVEAGETAETMSQEQLTRRLEELHKEAAKRAKPIDTTVVPPSIDDMFK